MVRRRTQKRGGDRRFELTIIPEDDEHVYQYKITDETRSTLVSNVDAIRSALNTLVHDGELESGTSFSNIGSFEFGLQNNKLRIVKPIPCAIKPLVRKKLGQIQKHPSQPFQVEFQAS
jgi:hypothetical protein